MKNPRTFLTLALASILFIAATPSSAQQDFSAVQIEATALGSGVYMLTGSGGNLGLSVGDNGAFLVDDQFAPLTEKIMAAVAEVSDQPIRFVVNTHWHGDHTGGNENLGARGAIVVAHQNVRERMSTEQFLAAFDNRVPPSPPGALPVVTFQDAVTFHWNGDEIHVFHVADAHTDGDAVVHFTNANVVHMGDTFFNGMYPFIDASTGGSIDGMISAANHVLGLADGNTKIIPGHGPMAGKQDLMTYRDMLETVRDRMRMLIAEGHSRDEIVAEKPTADLDQKWGAGFMKPDPWVGIVYDSMTASN